MPASAESPSDILTRYLRSRGLTIEHDFAREALRLMVQLLMELEVSNLIQAIPYERKDERRAYRNGYRKRIWRTRLGDIPLQIPKLRHGTYTPSFSGSLRRAEQMLLNMARDIYIRGVNMREVESIVREMGLNPTHASQIADMAEQLDDLVYEFRQRPLVSPYPHLHLDVLRLPGTEQSGKQEAAIAIGIDEDGKRDLLSFEITRSADGWDFWAAFLDDLVMRGLRGVEVVTSDDFFGIKRAVEKNLPEAEWYYSPAPEVSPLVSAVSSQRFIDSSVGLSGGFEQPQSNLVLGQIYLTPVATFPDVNLTDDLLGAIVLFQAGSRAFFPS
jgi:putative transposase